MVKNLDKQDLRNLKWVSEKPTSLQAYISVLDARTTTLYVEVYIYREASLLLLDKRNALSHY